MQKITCLADIIAHTPRVRVIKEGDENYGKEFDISENHFREKEIRIYMDGVHFIYKYSEIQFLTPVQYEGRYIGLGDKVNGKEVFDYVWSDGEWRFRASREGNYSDTYLYDITEIRSFEPLHQLTPKIELSTEELVEELRRRGVITQGNIINQ